MLIAETALRRHPWRYSFEADLGDCRESIYQGCRDRGRQRSEEAEGGTQPKQLGSTGLRGLDWLLTSVLPLIAWAQDREASWSQVSWECHDAEAYLGTEGHPCKRPKRLRTAVEQRLRERCSFHRAEFFRQLAGCLTTLQRVADIESESPVYGWASHISQQEAQALLKEFSNLSHFSMSCTAVEVACPANPSFGGGWRQWRLRLRADNPPIMLSDSCSLQGPCHYEPGMESDTAWLWMLYRYKMIPSRRHRPFLVMGCKSSPVQRRALVQAPRGAWLYLLCQSRSTQDSSFAVSRTA